MALRFSLTPSLSRWERGRLRWRFGPCQAAHQTAIHAYIEHPLKSARNQARRFPPPGHFGYAQRRREGLGEGDRDGCQARQPPFASRESFLSLRSGDMLRSWIVENPPTSLRSATSLGKGGVSHAHPKLVQQRHAQPDHEDVDDGDGQQVPPAEVHELVVLEARERPADPDEAGPPEQTPIIIIMIILNPTR